ncbi:DUF2933 domain-containing protein [Azospirillum largimobile]
MTHEHPHHTPGTHRLEPQVRLPWYRTWTGLACLGAAAVGAVYLSLYHVTHVLDALPLVLLLLCPLMHVFMHGGHGHGGNGHGGSGDDAGRQNKGGSP